MNHEVQPSGFDLLLDMVDIISLIIYRVYRKWKIVVDLLTWQARQAFQPVSKDVTFQLPSITNSACFHMSLLHFEL